jgi:dihydrofolate synthase/folylpolyglutamate synthase
MTYAEALTWLDSFQNYEKSADYSCAELFSLARVSRLLELLKNPHRAYPVLHVAGTKGKGSTCVLTESVLRALGFKTGFYSSPHLFSFCERIRIHGVPIAENDFAALVEQIKPLANPDLTYFEITTVLAFLYFARQRVDVAVIEVGLGGRLDATNLVSPQVTAITPVSLDHCAQLGKTVSEIAVEKAGIIKPGIPVVAGIQPEPAMRVIREIAARQQAPLHSIETQMRWSKIRFGVSGTTADLESPVRNYTGLTIPLLGRHQLDNAAAAIRIVELFLGSKLPDSSAVAKGISSARWPCRFQIEKYENRTVILDGAQNENSAQRLRETVESLFPGKKIHLIAGCSTGKEKLAIARAWQGWPSTVVLTQSNTGRPEPVENLRKDFSEIGCAVTTAETVPQALRQALAVAKPDDLIVVSGSLFVAAEALSFLKSNRTTADSSC